MTGLNDRQALSEFEAKMFEAKMRVIPLAKCGSTMDEARMMLQAGETLPFAIVTDEQVHGRGRSGATWFHAKEGLAVTFALPALPNQQHCLGLSLAIGSIIADFLESRYGVPIRLKWPNDLFDELERKVGGILIELLQYQGAVVPLVGVGINLGAAPAGVMGAAGLGLSCQKVRWVWNLSEEILSRFEIFRESGFLPFREEFLGRAVYLGEEISFRVAGENQTGVFQGITDSGAMIVKQLPHKDGDAPLVVHSADEVRRSR